ncbi:MAG: Zn-dependent hydrolase [Marinobacter excellens HL-55]|uniref:Zn-dependent hydrolase n=1 Tax=Marinobacter excellens HL-55 TaxID=1305731 RepID=A0A0P8BAI2_9GAMM|nr:MAG: Zn-dependent hydrolase [Marinobacter excellens HL-55]
MQKPIVTHFFDAATNTFSYVVKDPGSKACAIIDSVLDFDYAAGRTDVQSADDIVRYVQENDLVVEWILETHVHADHLSAAPYLQERLGGKTGIGARIIEVQEIFGKAFNAGTEFARDGSQFGQLFEEGDRFRIGGLEGDVLHSPGHTPACLTYVIGDAAFVGDTLFAPDSGTARCDFPGGDAKVLYQSAQKVLALPAETRIFLCHDYKAPGRDEFQHQTTVAEQRARNIHVREGMAENEFVRLRTERDATLNMPRLILPSVQVNMRAGEMPEADENGQVYLKVPVNRF